MPTYRFPTPESSIILPGESSLINQLLHGRNITESAVAEKFLSPNYDLHRHDPFLLHDMDKAVERIVAAIEAKETIAIFSDYDCDGIPGAVILHDCFKALNHEHFFNYIPHRHFEGFGLSTSAIDTIKERGATLIITIDCGTGDVEAVAHANTLGIDVIVTDHHEPGAALPGAVAVVNPKLGSYPFTELCGAAVAFKLAEALLTKTNHSLSPGQEKWWLDMVGIATIADMVPLIDENRVFAHYGLQVLRKSRRPGLQQLLKKNRIDQRYLTEDDIGFTIGPRINAASRMDTPEDAFFVLASQDVAEASAKVNHLENLNKERKTMVAQMTKELHKRLETIPDIPDVLVLGNPSWRPSLVGLAANKLAEEHNRPVFLWGRDGNGAYKGSCRSGGGVSVVKLMEAASDVFLEHGGHHFSGGFSVKEEHIFTFSEALLAASIALGNEAVINEDITIDAELTLDGVTSELLRDLAKLAPYGTGNHKPLFAFRSVIPASVEQFGKGKEHVKLIYQTSRRSLEAIAFFATATQFQTEPKLSVPHTLLAHVENSFFMGRQQIRLRIVDII